MLEPTNSEEMCECVRGHERVIVQNGCTKRRLVGNPDGCQLISTRALSGSDNSSPVSGASLTALLSKTGSASAMSESTAGT